MTSSRLFPSARPCDLELSFKIRESHPFKNRGPRKATGAVLGRLADVSPIPRIHI